MRKVETIEKGEEEAVGNKVRVKVVKNKCAPPFRKVELEIMFGKGISWSGSLIDAAVKYGIVDKKGAWYTWGEEKVGQGRDNAKLYIEQNLDAAAQIEARVRELVFAAQHPESKAAEPSSAIDPAPAAASAAKAGPPVVAEKPATAAESARKTPARAARPSGAFAKPSPPAEEEGLF